VLDGLLDRGEDGDPLHAVPDAAEGRGEAGEDDARRARAGLQVLVARVRASESVPAATGALSSYYCRCAVRLSGSGRSSYLSLRSCAVLPTLQEMDRAGEEMERAVQALLGDLERSGPGGVGAPVRGVVVLARGVGDLFPGAVDPLARRRRRAGAARLARRALSLGTAVHGVIADRPDAARAWPWNVRELARRMDRVQAAGDGESCVRALAKVAGLVLELPPLADEDEWQAGLIAFADETVLAELHEACLELAAVALMLAVSS